MLQSVGVSTTGDGSSLLAQDSRSKESQLENASIVAALVAGMTRGMRSIYVSVEIAEYVALLQKYELLDGTATLAEKLDAMPRFGAGAVPVTACTASCMHWDECCSTARLTRFGAAAVARALPSWRRRGST